MNIKPILFNTDMVRAILANEKTQTRRLIKPQPKMILSYVACSSERRACGKWRYPSEFEWKMWKDEKYKLSDSISEEEKEQLWTPPADADDILWVRETWSTTDKCGLYPNWPIDSIHYMYKADDPTCDEAKEARWYPSIHMPKQAARIFLRVKEVRVEPLQEMTEDDVSAEGADRFIQCPNEHVTYDPDGTLEDMCWNTDCCKVCEYITKSCGELFGEFVWNHTIPKNDLPKYGWDANPLVWVIEFERCEKPKGWCSE
nr:MAG TPA: ASCH domain protein [Caudoviricetes sp.]